MTRLDLDVQPEVCSLSVSRGLQSRSHSLSNQGLGLIGIDLSSIVLEVELPMGWTFIFGLGSQFVVLHVLEVAASYLDHPFPLGFSESSVGLVVVHDVSVEQVDRNSEASLVLTSILDGVHLQVLGDLLSFAEWISSLLVLVECYGNRIVFVQQPGDGPSRFTLLIDVLFEVPKDVS